jgi:hypothetical protein
MYIPSEYSSWRLISQIVTQFSPTPHAQIHKSYFCVHKRSSGGSSSSSNGRISRSSSDNTGTVMNSSGIIIIIIIIIIISSSVSPLRRVSTFIFLRQTMSLGNTVLQLF